MTKQRFYFKMVMSSLIRRRSRMLAALLAVAVGATILSGLITISLDIPRQMGREFRSYGANMVLIPKGAAIPLEAVEKAAAFIPREAVTGIAPYRYQLVKINEQPFMAAGTYLAEAKKTSPYWLVQGRWPEKPWEALIGQEVADTIHLVPGGAFIIAGTGSQGNMIPGAAGGEGRSFTVSGIVQTGGSEEAFIFMSLEDFEAMIGNGGGADTVECSISASVEELESIAARISAQVPAVQARLVKRVADSEGAVLSKLKALIFLVTVIVLLLIMICVATTMMAVVAERRKEIGLRKALGAGSRSLAAEFMGEGIFLGAAGGLLGAVFGFVFARYVGLRVFNQPVALEPLLPPLTVLASMAITAAACLLPVRSATRVDPAIVLRGE
ncbi:MAG: ABC transporter permease [Treponema sp.]|jgi:putative ABC transport system permease protein|nr:ABC transporter permease [Treponema sp.]